MNGFIAFMEKYFIPYAAKIGGQRHLVAIRDGFITTMPLMILGSFAVLINNFPIPAYQKFMNNLFGEGTWQAFGGNVWNGTFAILALLIAFTVAYNLAKSYDKDPLSSAVVSVATFFTIGAIAPGADGIANTGGLGSTGLFLALIIAILSTEIFTRLSGSPKLIINMPDGVPPAVSRSFAALFPAMITVSIFGLITAFFQAAGVTNLVISFYELVQEPFMGLANSLPAALLLAFVSAFLWFFGLHGANIIDPFMQTINIPAIEANVKALEAGKELPYIVNKPFFDSFVNLGGTGATIGLIIAIFIVARKHKAYMTVSKLSAAPGIFNINEPMMFGSSNRLESNYVHSVHLGTTCTCNCGLLCNSYRLGTSLYYRNSLDYTTNYRWSTCNTKYRWWRTCSCKLRSIYPNLPSIRENRSNPRATS